MNNVKSDLQDEILNAILTHNGWNKIAELLIEHFQSSCAVLGFRYKEKVTLITNTGYSSNDLKKYLAFDQQLNPVHHFLNTASPGDIATESTMSDYLGQPFEETEYYKKVSEPSGVRYGLACLLASAEDERFSLFIGRNHTLSPYSKEDIDTLRKHIPLINHAINISKKIDLTNIQTSVFENTIENLNSGVIFIDSNMNIQYHNQSAKTFLPQEKKGMASNNQLFAIPPNDYTQLKEKIRSIIQLTNQGKHNELPLLCVPIKQHGDTYLHITLIPVRANQSIFGFSMTKVVILIQQPDQKPESFYSCIKQLYGFTRAEDNIAQNLISGLTLRQSADKNHVKYETARTHLKNIFQKTGVNSQAKLIKLLITGPTNTPAEKSHQLNNA